MAPSNISFYIMADVNAPSGQAPAMAPPVRTNEEIVPRNKWVQIRKSNRYLDLDKKQSNSIYKMADTIQYDKKAGSYRCQLDKQWFVLTKDTLREALQITPINNNQAFVAPPSTDVLVDFVNELGYPKLVRNVSNFVTNDMFQPWRALTTIINLCLTGKTSGFERPRAPRRHKFQPRPDSLLHLPNEKHVLGYLKFSAKGSKREVFRMPIPGSHLDSRASMPTKPARKPKSTAPTAPPRPSVSIPVTSAQPAPTSASAKPPEKKRKQATETSDKPPKAKKSKYDWVLEESMKTAYAVAPRGPLPPVVIREPESGKYQPLPEVPGKGKAKVSEEQVAHDLLSLQKAKKKSPADQYILQRHISKLVGSSLYDDSLYAVLGQSDSKEESKKVVLGATEGGNYEDQAGLNPGAQAEGQTGIDAGTLDEGQAGSNPDEMPEGQAGPDPGNAGDEEQSIPSPVVYAGSNREHMDLDVADVSPPSTEQLGKGFTATAYPKVQESLKLTVEEQVLLEEPASSSGTLSSLQHLSRDISFGDQFFSDKPSDANKNAETEVETMVNVPIQQALSSISLMTSPIIDLTSRPKSPKVHQQFKATTTNTTTITPRVFGSLTSSIKS
nr:hypothetical protein [Tanacetum cinerariifolium]